MTTKTKINNLPKALETTMLKVERAQGTIYCLIEIRIFENTVYCISVMRDEFSAELVGNVKESAERLFDVILGGCVPPYQLFDVVSDWKMNTAQSFESL